MVLLFAQKLGLNYSPSRLENQNLNSRPLSAALDVFRAKISTSTSEILSKPAEGSGTKWVQKCFTVLDMINQEFARLVVEIDYQMEAWGGETIDEFLKYSLQFMDLLNSISSSVSHLNQGKVSLFYALSLVEKSPSSAKKNLLQIQPKCFTGINLGEGSKLESSSGIEERSCAAKEFVILQALSAKKSIEFQVLEGILSAVETRKSASNLNVLNKKCFNSRFCNEESVAMEEVREVNDAVKALAGEIYNGRRDEVAKELKRRLVVLENSLDQIERKTKSLFSQVLATRNQLIGSFRLKN